MEPREAKIYFQSILLFLYDFSKSTRFLLWFPFGSAGAFDDIMISGFGKFQLNEKSPRKGRNPATGKAMMLDGRKTVTFNYSGKLRDQVNKTFQDNNIL